MKGEAGGLAHCAHIVIGNSCVTIFAACLPDDKLPLVCVSVYSQQTYPCLTLLRSGSSPDDPVLSPCCLAQFGFSLAGEVVALCLGHI